MRTSLRTLALLVPLAALAGCMDDVPRADIRGGFYSEFPGWSADATNEALGAFRQSCPRLVAGGDTRIQTEGAPMIVTASDWQRICAAAAEVAPRDAPGARTFFEANFRPVAFAGDGRFTGYFEPEIRGSRAPSRRFTVPVYRRPPDLRPETPYLTRTEIENGALRGRGLEIAWVEDSVGLFEIQVQGSGRIALAEGGVMRLGFDGSNNRPYTALAKILADEGVMPRDQATWPRIRKWLQDNPQRAREIMRRNERYIFFRDTQGQGPLGAQGVALTAGRSAAVDPRHTPYGVPIYVDTVRPVAGGRGVEPYRRLMVAQDTGTAIVGPARVDIFYGAGPAAADWAGRQNHPGRVWMLVPRKQ